MVLTVTITADDGSKPVTLLWDVRNPWGSFSAAVTGMAQGVAGEGTDEPLVFVGEGAADGLTIALE